MTIAKWSVLAACLLPILTIGIAKATLARQSRKNGGYDNHLPREWETKLAGWRARASAAQMNGFEALPLFIAGVVFAQMAGADQGRIDMLALSFVVIRIVYVLAYLKDWATARSLIWTAGLGVSVALLAMGA
jgi:uncharacterized MAPEG superfamily protein